MRPFLLACLIPTPLPAWRSSRPQPLKWLRLFGLVMVGLVVGSVGISPCAQATLAAECRQIVPQQAARGGPISFRLNCPDASHISVVVQSAKSAGNNLTKLKELTTLPGTWVGEIPPALFGAGETVRFIVIFQPSDNTCIVQESLSFQTR